MKTLIHGGNALAALRACFVLGILCATYVPGGAQSGTLPAAPELPAAASLLSPFRAGLTYSHNPLNAYRATIVPQPVLANSSRLEQLVRDGKLYLSLRDAVDLALENNLDLAIARYNLPIADTDILRTQAGGVFRGVNTGVVQGTPGGGVGGLGSGAPGIGAGGTSAGAGGAGAGASGQVSSTLGIGPAVSSYDPEITVTIGGEHQTTPLSNLQIYGVPGLQLNTSQANFSYTQAFATGTSVEMDWNNGRQTTNSIYSNLNPAVNAQYRVTIRQPLLAGFGLASNLRYVRIARNNKKISDIAFRDQVIETVTQIENIYWDLVSAYEQVDVNEQSLAFAQQNYENAKKQVALEAIPAIEVMRAETEVSRRAQDLTVARTTLELQESLLKNALTKTLDDPILEEMPVIPIDRMDNLQPVETAPLADLIQQAMKTRPELLESEIDLKNREISRVAARNALLPSLSLIAYYGGSGLAGEMNPAYQGLNSSSVPIDFGGAVRNAFSNSAPDYLVGVSLIIPLRNRVGKADQYRAELEYRQAELRREQLRKQIRIEVRNAQYAEQQCAARVQSAQKARELAQKTFEVTKREQELGAGSNFQTLTAQRDLALAELDMVTASTAYQKAQIELSRVTGTTLERNAIKIDDAINGTIAGQN
jgi:outer membrane protein TolC